MEKPPPHIRFRLRKFDDEPYWSVIHIFTGQPHKLNGISLDSLEVYEADNMVDLLNLNDMKSRGILKRP